MKNKFSFLVAFTIVLLLGACGGQPSEEDLEHDSEEAQETIATGNQENKPVDTILVELKNNKGDTVGKAELTEVAEGVAIKLEAEQLSPGAHGFHIHEKGHCEAPTFETAGGHFNPTGKSHGLEHEDGPHAGDMPNLEVGEDGKVQVELINEFVTLKSGEPNSILDRGGTALVIHADPDDGKSQPAGNAGERIVCGVISK